MLDETAPTQTSETAATTVDPVDASAVGDASTGTTGALPGLGEAAADGTVADAPAGDAPPVEAPVIPDAYELAAPEGYEVLDAEMVAAATPVFKELGLTNEQANKLMPVAGQMVTGLLKRINDEAQNEVITRNRAWEAAWDADPEIGGANKKASLTQAAKALELLGMPVGHPYRKHLTETGLGNDPEVIRAWSKVGKAIGEDADFHRGGGSAVETNAARILYPNDKPKGA